MDRIRGYSDGTVRDEGLWSGGGRDAYWTRLGNVMHGVAHTTLKDGAVAAINAGLAARGLNFFEGFGTRI